MTTKAKTAEKEAATVEGTPDSVEFVEFTDAQHFEVRTITQQDWNRLGVEDGKVIHWHRGNKFRVPRSEFDFLTEEQFGRYILADARLIVVTE